MQIKWILVLIALVLFIGWFILPFVYDPIAHAVPRDVQGDATISDVLPIIGQPTWYRSWYDRASDPVTNFSRYDAKASVAIGDVLTSSNQSGLSLYWYERANADVPNDPDILKRIGDTDIRNGQTDAANQVFDTVLAANNNDTVALQRKGLILTSQGDYSDAVTYYDQVLAQNPNDANTLVMKGDTLMLSSMAQLQNLKDQAQNLGNYSSSGSDQSGNSIQDTDSYKEAIQCYDRAMLINPALTVPITAKIMSASMAQANAYQNILDDLK